MARTRLWSAHGDGGLAVIEAATGRTISNIALPAHPKDFRSTRRNDRLYVNLPENKSIAAIALSSGKQIARWGSGPSFANFPMALGA
jgi:hypothetical protein